MAEPGDHRAAPAGGHGNLRASHADREQVIEVLKDAFAQGRLTRHELDARAGQAFTSRTYAELAALTADIPAGLAPAPPPRRPARAQNRAPGSHTARDVAIGLVAGLIIVVALFGGLLQYALLLIPLAFPVAVALPLVLVASRRQPPAREQLPPRPGQGGQTPEVQQPRQAGHDPALPRDRPDEALADLRTDSSRPGRTHYPAAGQSPSSRHRQNGCPAGSSRTRTLSCGWNSATRAPRARASATAASRSVTWMSRCIIVRCCPGAGGQTGAT
jgi:hypothetical protein